MSTTGPDASITRYHLLVGAFVFLPIAIALVILTVVILNALNNGQWPTLTVALVLLVVANVILYVGMDTITDI